jgi:hypothetical protein
MLVYNVFWNMDLNKYNVFYSVQYEQLHIISRT